MPRNLARLLAKTGTVTVLDDWMLRVGMAADLATTLQAVHLQVQMHDEHSHPLRLHLHLLRRCPEAGAVECSSTVIHLEGALAAPAVALALEDCPCSVSLLVDFAWQPNSGAAEAMGFGCCCVVALVSVLSRVMEVAWFAGPVAAALGDVPRLLVIALEMQDCLGKNL